MTLTESIIHQLGVAKSDPMWADHCEISKSTLGKAIAELKRLELENKSLKTELAHAKSYLRELQKDLE